MQKVYDYTQMDWNNIRVLERGRLPARSFVCTYRDREEAEQRDYKKSSHYRSLNGRWLFAYYANPFLVPENIMDPSYPEDAFASIPVPGHWQLHGYDKPVYNDCFPLFPILDEARIQVDNPCGVYRLHVNCTKQDDLSYILRFDGVESAFHVYLNGHRIGYSQGSRLYAEFELTEHLINGDNCLCVQVYKFCDGSYLENQDMWWFSGIMRDVAIISRPLLHLANVKCKAELTEDACSGNFLAELELENPTFDQELEIGLSLERAGEEIWREKKQVTVYRKENSHVEVSARLAAILPWSAETPELYDLFICIKDPKGQTLECYAERCGFRRIECKDGLILFNGRAIKFKGVNRHDWHPATGRCVSRSDIREDMLLMKQHNINAIRTSHYPPTTDFINLADELGFYVMEEADIECNQMTYIPGKMSKISNDPRWEKSYVDRVERMVARDINHCSVVIWSLGNESGFGHNFVAAAAAARAMDTSRPLHYEEDRDAVAVDMYSSMYSKHEDLIALGRDTSKTKPHIVCEYAHAMGNGPGCLDDYWKIFWHYPRLQGAFVWEWVDLALYRQPDDPESGYLYGGDFGDAPNSGAFCCDGLLQASRRLKPVMAELKYVLQPVHCLAFSWEDLHLRLKNRYDFTCLSALHMHCKVWSAENVYAETQISLPRIAPGEEATLDLSPALAEALQASSGQGELWLDLSFRLREAVCWTELPETEVARAQFGLPLGDVAPAQTEKPKLSKKDDTLPKDAAMPKDAAIRVEERGSFLHIKAGEAELLFDLPKAQIARYQYRDDCLIEEGLGFNFWRAPIDNDKNLLPLWQKQMLPFMCHVAERVAWELKENELSIHCHHVMAPYLMEWKILLESHYLIQGDGLVKISVSGTPVGQLPPCLPRIGMRFKLPLDLNHASWYGRGPEESYADCKNAQFVGIYRRIADEMYVPYVLPQENGSHQDTRCCCFSKSFDASSKNISDTRSESSSDSVSAPCLNLAGEKDFSFSLLPYSQEELTQATHSYALKKASSLYLCVDAAQHGLGSASWGPETLAYAWLKPEPFHFNWLLQGQAADFSHTLALWQNINRSAE